MLLVVRLRPNCPHGLKPILHSCGSATVGWVKGCQIMKDGSSTAPARCRRTWILLAAIVLCAAGRLAAFEFEYWPKAIVRVALNDQWQLGFEQWATLTDNAGRFKDSQTDIWLYYFGLADWLSVGTGYKRVYTKAGDDWTTEDRPMFDARRQNESARLRRGRSFFRMSYSF